jgi:hypothetical protein
MYPQQPYGNPYISPQAMQAAQMNWASPDVVVPSGNADLDMLNQAVQYEAATFPPGFGGLQHFTASNEALMDRARGFYTGQNMPNSGHGPQGSGEGGLPASAGGERSTGRRLMGAAATTAVAGGVMAGLAIVGGVNVWNPIGWACLGAAALVGFFL